LERAKGEHRVVELRQQIAHHNYRYYTLDDPEVSDAHYDRLIQELTRLEQEFPGGRSTF
jgi:DNA ligase (NAD+)